MNFEDQDKRLDGLIRDRDFEKEYPSLSSPFFAQKVIGQIKKSSGTPSLVFYFLQNKYTYWVLFLGLVLFPAWAEANSLRLLCFS